MAAVDVGILNLTRYLAPDPVEYFFGQRQLSTEIRDLYGYLIDGMQGTRGSIRSGGDMGGAIEGSPPTQERSRVIPASSRSHPTARRRSNSTSRPSTARPA